VDPPPLGDTSRRDTTRGLTPVARDEAIALLFNVSDAVTPTNIERFLKEGEDDGEEETDEG
jgi:hypothetical protein